MKKFNFIIVPTDTPEEPEVKRCCGNCGKWHHVWYFMGEYSGIDICRDTLDAVRSNQGTSCPAWELNNNLTPQDFDPDVQDVEVRLRKMKGGGVITEFKDKDGQWLCASNIFSDGTVACNPFTELSLKE